jgi:ankyrin repeat protein
MKTIIVSLFASCVVSLAQTNAHNSNSLSDKSAPFEATAQLMNAVQYDGSPEAVKLLLDKGANVNAKDNEGWHPLQHAAKRGNLEIVKLLLEKGADVNATNGGGGTALVSAAYRGYTDIAKLLVERGANVNTKENDQTTPLMWAARAGQTNSVVLLLNNGADINATNWSGDTILMTAVGDGKIDVVRLLLAKGANVNVENFLGRSALDEAKQNGNTAIVQLLLNTGAIKSSSTMRDEEMTEMTDSLKKEQESWDALSNRLNSLRNFQQHATIPMSIPVSVPKKSVKPTFTFGTNTDSSGYVTNASLLTPFTVTNSAGAVFTNAVLVKLMPNKFIYKTPGGSGGTLRLDLLPEDLLQKIGYDPQTAQAADETENLKKARQQELAQQQRELAAQQANVPAQRQSAGSDISRSIRAFAEIKWPTDYEMQKYEVDKQTEAYNWVVAASSASGVPQEVFSQIKTKAAGKWPDDYDMQKYEIEKQVKAYGALH